MLKLQIQMARKTTYTIKTKRLTTDEEETYKEDTNTKKIAALRSL